MSNTPKIRFAGFTEEWQQRKFKDNFEMLTNNTLSRADLNDDSGTVSNIHYGDILVKFGEIINLKNEKLPFISDTTNIPKTTFLQEGDLIIADTAEDTTVGKCVEITGVLDLNVQAGLHTVPCRPKTSFATGYLGYFMNSPLYHDQLFPLMQGTKVTSVSKTALQTTVLCYPPDIEEQADIGQCFIKLDKLITLHQRKYEKLVSLKAACLDKMFPKKENKMPEVRFVGFTESWKKHKVSKLFKVTRGYVLASTLTESLKSEENPYPVYSSQTKDNGLMGYYSDYLYEDAITWTTDGANAGTVNYRSGKFYCTNVCGVLLSNTVPASRMIAESINNVAKNHVSYVGNPKLMNNVMAEIEIKISSEPEEREKISDFLNTLDKLIFLHQCKLEKLKQVKQSMLHNMFV